MRDWTSLAVSNSDARVLFVRGCVVDGPALAERLGEMWGVLSESYARRVAELPTGWAVVWPTLLAQASPEVDTEGKIMFVLEIGSMTVPTYVWDATK